MRYLILFTILISCGQQRKAGGGPDPLTVQVEGGTLRGGLDSNGVRFFKGIPFAAPPVGVFRWKEPQPAPTWSGVRTATSFGPRAMQPPIFGDMAFRSNGMSEDCLYLNVWAPARPGATALPVLLYFYGGGFVAGDGSEGRYDGGAMAGKGIVTVTCNYRLGIFGFMAHPELSAEPGPAGSGNWGLLDQAAALRWVRANIRAFGGDPERITIAGESAGSISVSAQMASPLSRHLIKGAIGESGSVLGALPAVPLKTAEETGLQFAKSVGAASLADLRALPAGQLVEAATKFGPFRFSPTIDGYFFPKDPFAIYAAGEQARVPLLAGWNSEEAGAGAVLGNAPATRENFNGAVRRLYGNNADAVLEVYRAATDEEVRTVATDLAGDRFISFATWRWIEHQRRTGQPVYRYRYERPRPAPRAGGAAATGAAHSAEIEYAMGNLSLNPVYAWTEEDHAVSRTLQGYFVNFIKTGSPNGSGLPQWPAVPREGAAPVMHIDVGTRSAPETDRARYQLLERLAANR